MRTFDPESSAHCPHIVRTLSAQKAAENGQNGRFWLDADNADNADNVFPTFLESKPDEGRDDEGWIPLAQVLRPDYAPALGPMPWRGVPKPVQQDCSAPGPPEPLQSGFRAPNSDSWSLPDTPGCRIPEAARGPKSRSLSQRRFSVMARPLYFELSARRDEKNPGPGAGPRPGRSASFAPTRLWGGFMWPSSGSI